MDKDIDDWTDFRGATAFMIAIIVSFLILVGLVILGFVYLISLL